MESFVSLTFAVRRADRFSIIFGLDWTRFDWFVVSLLVVVAVILSLMLHLPLE